MPHDYIPSPMKKREVKASLVDSTGKIKTHIIVFGLDTSKVTRMHNLYIDIHDEEGRIVCQTYVLPPKDIHVIQKLLKETQGTIALCFDGKEYVFKKRELAEAFLYLETKKRKETGGFGFCFLWALSVNPAS